jgi:hypothetical protein
MSEGDGMAYVLDLEIPKFEVQDMHFKRQTWVEIHSVKLSVGMVGEKVLCLMCMYASPNTVA